jgi:hypothetical protein
MLTQAPGGGKGGTAPGDDEDGVLEDEDEFDNYLEQSLM